MFFLLGGTAAGGKKLAWGANSNAKHKGLPSKHAEVAAIEKIKRKRNIPKALDIVVIRLSPTGQLGESRPCYHCICAMLKSELPIKNVYYSTKSGNILKEKLTDMKNHHLTKISSGMRFRLSIKGYDYTKLLKSS